MKLVHKDRLLELVGWYTLLPRTGPTPEILPLHRQILSQYNESAVLLAFHPDELSEQSASAKLPLTIYESNAGESNVTITKPDGEDKEMKDGGNETACDIKFRELPYSVETSEAEMISMDFVARGAANAKAVEGGGTGTSTTAAEAKGKGRLIDTRAPATAATNDVRNALSREEEELIASLTAKSNAVKMLHSRINLIIKYLQKLPPSPLTGSDEQAGPYTTPSYNILRSIQALASRLDIVSQPSNDTFKEETLSESNDVHLIALLNDVIENVCKVREVGKKSNIVEQARQSKSRQNNEFGSSSGIGAASFSISNAGDILA